MLNPTEDYYRNYKKHLASIDLENNHEHQEIEGNDNQAYEIKDEIELKTTLSVNSNITAF